jgi:hypothetical protein
MAEKRYLVLADWYGTSSRGDILTTSELAAAPAELIAEGTLRELETGEHKDMSSVPITEVKPARKSDVANARRSRKVAAIVRPAIEAQGEATPAAAPRPAARAATTPAAQPVNGGSDAK